MASVKRKIRRRQGPDLIKVPLHIQAWCEDGNLAIAMTDGFWIGGTGRRNTGIPDGDLPWLADRIGERLGRTRCCCYEGLLCLADAVIEEQKPVLVALADSRGNGKGRGRFVTLLSRIRML